MDDSQTLIALDAAAHSICAAISFLKLSTSHDRAQALSLIRRAQSVLAMATDLSASTVFAHVAVPFSPPLHKNRTWPSPDAE